MGKSAKKEAKKLGYFNLPHTRLHTRVQKMRMMFSKSSPDPADRVQDVFKMRDPAHIASSSGGGRNNTFFFLSESLRTYVEVADKCAGMVVHNTNNHVVEMNIYSENEDIIREIVRTIDAQYSGGMVNNTNDDIWKKISKKYKVRPEDAIAEWNKWLGPAP